MRTVAFFIALFLGFVGFHITTTDRAFAQTCPVTHPYSCQGIGPVSENVCSAQVDCRGQNVTVEGSGGVDCRTTPGHCESLSPSCPSGSGGNVVCNQSTGWCETVSCPEGLSPSSPLFEENRRIYETRSNPVEIRIGDSSARSTSDLFCTTSMTANEINKYFADNGYMHFHGTGESFYNFAQEFGINPALMIAIGIQESRMGNAYNNSPSALARRNAFGLMEPSGNGLMSFHSWADGARVAFRSVASYNCDTIECMGNIYAPVGATNDPTGLNGYWPGGVRRFFDSIPQRSCAAERPPSSSGDSSVFDIPSGWPIRAPLNQCAVTQHPYASFSHRNLNAVDLSLAEETPIYSTLNGTVDAIYVYRWNCMGGCPSGAGYGTYVRVKNNNSGAWTLYTHLIPDSVSHLRSGQSISRGDLIGRADNTGYSTGPHLHYEIPPGYSFPSYGTACSS